MGQRVHAAVVAAAMVATALLVPAGPSGAGGNQFSAGADGLRDPYFPTDGNGGYDVDRYDLEIAYVPATDVLTGTATIEARATHGLTRFNLDLDGLVVDAVTVDGRPARWTRAADELVITPEKRIHDHHRFTTVVQYHGVPRTLLDEHGEIGFIHTDDGTVVSGEPHSADTWYPVNDHPLDKAAYRFRITVPAGLEAVANGELTGSRTSHGRTTWTWVAREPMVSYVTTAMIGEFDLEAYRAGGLRYWDAYDPDLFDRPEPPTGAQYAMSQGGPLTYNRLLRTIEVPADGAELSFLLHRDVEADFDFAFVEAHTLGEDDWTTLPAADGRTSSATPLLCPFIVDLHPALANYLADDGSGEACVPTGDTGEWHAATGPSDGFEPWSVPLDGFAGSTIEVAITYVTDDLFTFRGLTLDDVVVTGAAGSTSFEADDDPLDGWTVPGAPEGSPGNETDWIAGVPAAGPPTVGDIARGALSRQPEILSFLGGLFGPYPFTTAGGIIDDHEGISVALENQTRPVYTTDFFFEVFSGEQVVAHELAHQWVGDHVSVARWSDIWLNEGFATYADWLWSEHDGYLTAQDQFDFYASIPPDSPFWSVVVADPGVADHFSGSVYFRGAMALHALRQTIGDADFFELLRSWIRRHAGGNVTISQFTRMAERISGQDLDALFTEWILTPERPASLGPAAADARTASAAAAAVATASASPSGDDPPLRWRPGAG